MSPVTATHLRYTLILSENGLLDLAGFSLSAKQRGADGLDHFYFSSSAASGCPLSTAKSYGVLPPVALLWASAPLSSRKRINSTLPACAAACSAVKSSACFALT